MNAKASTNPYQPPRALDGDLDMAASTEITFGTTAGLRRHAIDHYLLHWHPKRLLLSSLLMITVSALLIVGSTRYGIAAVVPTLLVTMLVSAAIYTALIFQTRRKISRRLTEYGLNSDDQLTLRSDPDQLTLVNDSGTYAWRYEKLQMHSTRRGFMVCPAPLLLIYIPRSEMPGETYEHLFKVMRSRTSP